MTDYEKLKKIIEEIDALINCSVRSSDPEFQAWHTKAERFLSKKYGKDSLEHKKLIRTYFSPLIWTGTDMEQENRVAVQYCCDGLESCKAIFQTYLEDLADENEAVEQHKSISKKSMDILFKQYGGI